VLLDTKGPEIRTGMLKDKKVTFVSGQSLKIVTNYEVLGDTETLACSYKDLPTTVKVGSTIFIADGSLTCTVTEIGDDHVIVRCENGVTLGERKNMNLPGAVVTLPTLTEKDEDDLIDFGLE
jgi:pyruvate kinase